jgi:hypothetical protein
MIGAAGWFSTTTDRTAGRARLDPLFLRSPGTIAAQIPARFGLRAPIQTFGLMDPEHERWAEASRGGRCDFDERATHLPYPVVSADEAASFPLVAHLTGWWDLLSAERIQRRAATAELRRLCQRAISDPHILIDPAVWRRFGCTLVEVMPDGELFPIEIRDLHRPDGRLEVTAVRSLGRPMFFSALDILASVVECGRIPRILKATRYVPVGRQVALRRRLSVLPGLVLDAKRDPAVDLVRHRRRVAAAGDQALAAELRLVVNALTFGNFCRFDELHLKVGGQWTRSEKPGPWNFLPIAASVTAGSRLLLALLDRMVTDLGGLVLYRDTDSSIILATPAGAKVQLPDGSKVWALSWDEVDGILGAFAPLNPAPWWRVWKFERGTEGVPLQSVIFGPKRHVEFVVEDGVVRIVERTESTLGGFFADPPTMTGRATDGGRIWSKAAVTREVEFVLARTTNPTAVRSPASWDEGLELPAPCLRHLAATSPEVLASLPTSLGAHPGSHFLEGTVDVKRRNVDPVPVALDPGGDLSNWQTLHWVARSTGEPVRVTTDPTDVGAVLLESLAVRSANWSAPHRSEPVGLVVVHPELIRIEGRISGVLDAVDDGLADVAARRPVYSEGDPRGFLQAEAKHMKKRAFARRTGLAPTTAERLARGLSIGDHNVEVAMRALLAEGSVSTCALAGCERPLSRPNQRYCSRAHQDRAYRARRSARRPGPAVPVSPTCPTCGLVLVGQAAQRECPRCVPPTTNKRGNGP